MCDHVINSAMIVIIKNQERKYPAILKIGEFGIALYYELQNV
jgi:hypothetical protein